MFSEGYYDYRNVSLDARTAIASPLQLVLVLMEELLQELVRARAHIAAKRIEEKGQSIDRCLNMLNGLSAILDTENREEVILELARLYDFAAQHLYRASFYLDEKLIDEVIVLLEEVKQGSEKIAAAQNT